MTILNGRTHMMTRIMEYHGPYHGWSGQAQGLARRHRRQEEVHGWCPVPTECPTSPTFRNSWKDEKGHRRWVWIDLNSIWIVSEHCEIMWNWCNCWTDIDVNQAESYAEGWLALNVSECIFLPHWHVKPRPQVGGASTGAGKDEGPVPGGVIAHLKPSWRSSVGQWAMQVGYLANLKMKTCIL